MSLVSTERQDMERSLTFLVESLHTYRLGYGYSARYSNLIVEMNVHA